MEVSLLQQYLLVRASRPQTAFEGARCEGLDVGFFTGRGSACDLFLLLFLLFLNMMAMLDLPPTCTVVLFVFFFFSCILRFFFVLKIMEDICGGGRGPSPCDERGCEGICFDSLPSSKPRRPLWQNRYYCCSAHVYAVLALSTLSAAFIFFKC